MVKAQAAVELVFPIAAVALAAAAAFYSAVSGGSGLNAPEFGMPVPVVASAADQDVAWGSGYSYADFFIELRVHPLQVGRQSEVEAIVRNSGAPLEIDELVIDSSNSSALPISGAREANLQVGESHTLHATAAPIEAGLYSITATAYGADGEPLRSSDGTLVSRTVWVTVLPEGEGNEWKPETGPTPTPGPAATPTPASTPWYSLSLERGNESIAYSIIPSTDAVKGAYVTHKERSWGMEGRGYCDCPGARAFWGYYAYSTEIHYMCGCLHYPEAARTAAIGTVPQPVYAIRLNITNAAGASASCTIAQGSRSCAFQNGTGTASFAGDIYAAGPSPALDSIVASPSGQDAWQLRSIPAYNTYQLRFQSLDVLASAVNGNMECSADCQGVSAVAASLESAKTDFLGSTAGSASACTVNSVGVMCSPSSFSYPELQIHLTPAFAGGQIPQANPDRRTISGISVVVSTD